MNTAIENALRGVARECRAEIVEIRKCHPKECHDPLTTAALDRYAKKITFSIPGRFNKKRWLSYYVRIIDKEVNHG
jgi:hypothetical protein